MENLRMSLENIEDTVRELTILIHRKGKDSLEAKNFRDTYIKDPLFRKALIQQYITQCKNVMSLLRFALDQTLEEEEWIIYVSLELESILDRYFTTLSTTPVIVNDKNDEYSKCECSGFE
jgi:hypothetical protein